jgi:hypothetical protein
MNKKRQQMKISIAFAKPERWSVPMRPPAQKLERSSNPLTDTPALCVRIYCRSATTMTTIVVWGKENPHRLVLRRSFPWLASASGA